MDVIFGQGSRYEQVNTCVVMSLGLVAGFFMTLALAGCDAGAAGVAGWPPCHLDERLPLETHVCNVPTHGEEQFAECHQDGGNINIPGGCYVGNPPGDGMYCVDFCADRVTPLPVCPGHVYPVFLVPCGDGTAVCRDSLGDVAFARCSESEGDTSVTCVTKCGVTP